MSAVIVNEIKRGFYLDSVALMRLSGEITALAGVDEAALMMASPANKAILRDAGLLEGGSSEAGSNDLVIAIRAHDAAAGQAALDRALQGLEQPRARAAEAQAWRPRSIRAAVNAMPGANLALIAVPGEFAAAEARKAMGRGLNVMMFSDNVSLEDELELKREAQGLGLLMMGPDCGTAIINGVPLAFANSVRRGNVGIIGASGTGVQEVASLVSEAGGGISHAIGVGGRDLREEIGGIMTMMAIDALDEDAATDRVVLISKPPDAAVAARVLERIGRSPRAYTVCFLGADDVDLPANATQVSSLRDAAGDALRGHGIGAGYVVDAAARQAPGRAGRGDIEGLFAGGTLCAEAQLILMAGGRRVGSNAPVPGADTIEAATPFEGDRVLDFGADELTRARPHPMIDPTLRDAAVRQALADPEVGAILVDVVIGHGAHADPAGRLAGIVAGRAADAPPIIASVTGTELDPQVRSHQERILRDAGIVVAPSNAHACEVALAVVTAHRRG